ncbi:UNVERIFIED_CONTAM: hypothetical protein NCL1_25376 [Trichonephila clavipes]
MFSSIDRVTAEIRERFQQLQNLAQKYACLRPEVILSMDELNLDQAPQDINKDEFQLELVRLQAFVAATDPDCQWHKFSQSNLRKKIFNDQEMLCLDRIRNLTALCFIADLTVQIETGKILGIKHLEMTLKYKSIALKNFGFLHLKGGACYIPEILQMLTYY